MANALRRTLKYKTQEFSVKTCKFFNAAVIVSDFLLTVCKRMQNMLGHKIEPEEPMPQPQVPAAVMVKIHNSEQNFL